MPKERRLRTVAHESSVRLHNRKFTAQDNAVERIEIGAAIDASGNDILAATATGVVPQETFTKKEKQMFKREMFLQRFSATKLPYSKSHVRREKRKAKERLAGNGLDDIQAVLSTIATDQNDIDETSADNKGSAVQTKAVRSMKVDQGDEQAKPRPKAQRALKIGESKKAHLSKNQRKKILNVEQLRQSLVRSNPEFSKNPFATIRTHTQNTLTKHQPPS